MRLKLAVIGITLPVVMVLDLVTKSWALEALTQPSELFGGLVPSFAWAAFCWIAVFCCVKVQQL